MSCSETLFVLGYGDKKSELLIPWVEVAQTALMHSELHVCFDLIFSTNDEHHIVTPVG